MCVLYELIDSRSIGVNYNIFNTDAPTGITERRSRYLKFEYALTQLFLPRSWYLWLNYITECVNETNCFDVIISIACNPSLFIGIQNHFLLAKYPLQETWTMIWTGTKWRLEGRHSCAMNRIVSVKIDPIVDLWCRSRTIKLAIKLRA